MSSQAARTKPKELPAWAWPLVGLTAGLALVVVIHGACFDRHL